MDQEEYNKKYVNLRILKSIQEYLKTGNESANAIFPIKVPDELLIQTVKSQGPDKADQLIHQIFKIGLSSWSDMLYSENFGSQENLEEFIELVKKRNNE